MACLPSTLKTGKKYALQRAVQRRKPGYQVVLVHHCRLGRLDAGCSSAIRHRDIKSSDRWILQAARWGRAGSVYDPIGAMGGRATSSGSDMCEHTISAAVQLRDGTETQARDGSHRGWHRIPTQVSTKRRDHRILDLLSHRSPCETKITSAPA